MRKTLCIVAAWLAAASAIAADPTPVSASQPADSSEARQKLGQTHDALMRMFSACPACGGRGEKKDRTCANCVGYRKIFTGDYQALLDGYLDLCDLREACAAQLKKETDFARHLTQDFDLFQFAIRYEIGPQRTEKRARTSPTARRLVAGRKEDGVCDILALDILAETEPPIGRGIAFEGKLGRLLKAEEPGIPALAVVRIQPTTGVSRACYVLVPPNAKWREYELVRVIGRVVDAPEIRKAHRLAASDLLVRTYPGTK